MMRKLWVFLAASGVCAISNGARTHDSTLVLLGISIVVMYFIIGD